MVSDGLGWVLLVCHSVCCFLMVWAGFPWCVLVGWAVGWLTQPQTALEGVQAPWFCSSPGPGVGHPAEDLPRGAQEAGGERALGVPRSTAGHRGCGTHVALAGSAPGGADLSCFQLLQGWAVLGGLTCTNWWGSRQLHWLLMGRENIFMLWVFND